MTAFDNIKTNNWPSGANDFEDFLVLELPLNDDAALASSRRDIVAGSKVLHPKLTLTNSGAFANTDVGSKWDASTTGSPFNGSWDVVFDGNATANTSTQGASYWHYTYESTTSITLRESISGQIEILAGRPGSNDTGTHSITLQSGGSDVHTVTLGTNGASGYQWFNFGNRSNIDKFVITGGDPGVAIWAVRLDNVLLVNPTGGPKKHYDVSTTLTSSSSNYIQTSGLDEPDSDDYTYECWAKANGTISSFSLFHTNPTSRAGILLLINSSTAGQMYFGNGSSWSSYTDMTFSAIDDQWHHYAISRQGGGTVRFFIDGQLSGSASSAGAHTHGELVLGRQSGDNNLYWNGAIQDVRVYKAAKYTSNFTPPGAILG